MPAIETRALRKVYPGVEALKALDLEVRDGEFFGLLGPNGAGKTTTIGILTTRVRPTSGTALVGGPDVARDAVAVRQRIGVVPQRPNPDRGLNVIENLLFHAAYFGIPADIARERADALLTQFGIASKARNKVDELSGGQQQRLMIARALIRALVTIEKVVAGMVQGFVAAAFVLPIARLVMGPIANLTFAHLSEVLGIVLLGTAAFSSLGMWLGTAIAPQQIGLMFSVIIAPMLFFGCAYYPWRGLDVVPVIKYLVLINPMVYVAEGMRGALTPNVPHMPLPIVVGALLVVISSFWTLGIRSFYKRAIG